MLFHFDKLKVRELERKDNQLLAKWLSNPSVLQFYEGRDNSFDLEKVNKKFYRLQDETVRCIIEFEEAKIGYMQFYPLTKSMREKYGYLDKEIIYGMDQFIGETKYWNRGVGELFIRRMVDYLVNKKYAAKVVMDPQTWNTRAIRCYEKCNFRKMKLLPGHELHEKKYRDCWLMEYRKER